MISAFHKILSSGKLTLSIILFLFVRLPNSFSQNNDSLPLIQKAQINAELKAKIKKIDSLKRAIFSSPDSTTINCLNLMSSEYYAINTDSAWICASEAFTLASKLAYTKGIEDGLLNLAQITQERGDFAGAEKYFRQATKLYDKTHSVTKWAYTTQRLGYNLFLQLRINEARKLFYSILPYYLEANDKKLLAYQYRLIGKTYDSQGYYEKAFEYFQKDLELSRLENNNATPRRSLQMWSSYYYGTLFKDAGDYKTASIYYRRNIEQAKENNLPDLYNQRMGDLHVLQNNFDSARYYYQLARSSVAERIPDPFIRKYFLLERAMNIGETYLAQKKYDTAFEYFKEPLKYCFPPNFLSMVILNDVARIVKGQHKLSEALHYAAQLLAMANACGARQYICEALELHWRIYHQQGRIDSAYKYHLLHVAMKDSITGDKQLRNISISEMKAENEIQRSRISVLNKEKEMHLVLLDKEALQKKILVAGILALLIIGFAIFRNIILKRQSETVKFGNKITIQQLESGKVKAELQQRANELEMHALRAQMNPHFIFNSLSAINMFILENNRLKASEYLSKFSRLIRLILQNSLEPLILLEKELDALQLYLELESLRFENRFEYNIIVADDIDSAVLKVPPLIIQPFVENAIWHGMMHKKENGRISIDLYVKDDLLHCKITDDGIGRMKSTELKSKSTLAYKSMGMRITADRIAMLLHQNQKQAQVSINDLVLPDGNAEGTEVIIKIPLCYD